MADSDFLNQIDVAHIRFRLEKENKLDDKTIRLWDYRSRRLISMKDIGVAARAVTFHPSGSHIGEVECYIFIFIVYLSKL